MAGAEVDMTSEFPKRLSLAGGEVEVRRMGAADEAAVLAFAGRLEPRELLFLRRDIRNPKVVAAWLREIEAGQYDTLLGWSGGEVVGCATLVRDALSWSAHVAEIRVVVARSMRGRGLGTALVRETFRLALVAGAEKIFAQMTTDQQGAIAVFEGLGFKPEAILREHVRDETGAGYDLVVLSHIVAEVAATLRAYGVDATADAD
jgi:RimJ/RimL family protein N-acetyltransferase